MYPPGLMDRVVAACGRGEQRRRLLPARSVVCAAQRIPYLAQGIAAVLETPPMPPGVTGGTAGRPGRGGRRTGW
nr:transposase domain-containing protein [Streptomyces olivochromogenes]